ncbi:hypothetical protein ABPG73_004683 [Tetrahymena malaccensis]
MIYSKLDLFSSQFQFAQLEQIDQKGVDLQVEEQKGGAQMNDENEEFGVQQKFSVPFFRSKQKSSIDQEYSCNIPNQINNSNTLEPLKGMESMISTHARSVLCKFNSEQKNPNIYINNQEQNLNILFDSVVEHENEKSQASQQNESVQTESQKLFLSPINKRAKHYFKKTEFQNQDQVQNKEEEEVIQKQDQNKLLTIHNIKFSNQVKPLISKLNIFCRKRFERRIKGLNPKEQYQIQEQIERDVDILNFFQDMLFLKKAVMLLLTEDQLASLQLVGCSQKFLELDFKNMDVGENYQDQFEVDHQVEEQKGGIQMQDENEEFGIYQKFTVPTFRIKQKFEIDQEYTYNIPNQIINSDGLESHKGMESKISNHTKQVLCKFNTEQQSPSMYINNQEQNLNTQFDSIDQYKLLTIHNTKFSSQVKPLISNLNIFCRKRFERRIKGLNPKEQYQIQEQIERDVDILNFFQDMLFLKKAVMLLLTEDQLASLQLVGCSQKFLELDFKNMDVSENYQEILNSLSPFETQFAIHQSKILQQQYNNKFIQRCSKNKKELSILDKKILLSIQKTLNC